MKCVECVKGSVVKGPVEISEEFEGHTFKAMVQGGTCDACGEKFYPSLEVRRFERAMALALARAGVNTGKAFKFMRKVVGLRAADLALLLGVTPETISRWETDKHPIDRNALSLLCLMVEDKVHGRTTTLDLLRAGLEPEPLAEVVSIDLEQIPNLDKVA